MQKGADEFLVRWHSPLKWPVLVWAAVCSWAAGCAQSNSSARNDLMIQEAPVSYVSIADTMQRDAQLENLVAPYRSQITEAMSRVIGRAVAQVNEARPEGPLGNLVADAMLEAAQSFVEDTVHIAVTNNGGLRIPILEGPITVGEVFELAPFENLLVVIQMSGAEIQSLADDIARVGGEPIAGFSFHIDGATGRAGGVRVGNAPLDRERIYRVVTLDYLADGGDNLRTLWMPRPRVTSDMLLREAIIAHIEKLQVIRPRVDDRIMRVAR